MDSFLTKEDFLKLREKDLFTYLSENPDIKVDTLIIEGTNIGSSRAPLSPNDAIGVIRRIALSQRPLLLTLHNLDFEYAYSMLKMSGELGLNCYVASAQIARLLERMPELPAEVNLIEGYTDYPTMRKKVPLEEVGENSLVLISHRDIIDLLRDPNFSLSRQGSPVAVLSEPEPEVEEALEYDVIANWLSAMGVQHYRIRASGHYYPYQLKDLISAIKPRSIKPIHTQFPDLLRRLAGL